VLAVYEEASSGALKPNPMKVFVEALERPAFAGPGECGTFHPIWASSQKNHTYTNLNRVHSESFPSALSSAVEVR
jgi:hypothetical protein